MGLFDFFNSAIGIDAGSSNLRIIKEGKLVFDEPSKISIDKQENKVTGIGKRIKKGATNVVLKPVYYLIEDFEAFEFLLRGSISHSIKNSYLLSPSYIMYFSIPSCANEVDKRAYRDSAEHAGAKEVYLIRSAVTTALGMSILFEKRNFILVDFSTSKIEISIFSNSVPITYEVIRLGTNKIEKAIKNYLKRAFNLLVTSEEVLCLIQDYKSNIETHKIQYKEVLLSEIEKVITPFVAIFVDEILSAIENVNNSNKNDILMNGIYFSGGGSNYSSLCNEISEKLGLKYSTSKSAFLDNINGLKKVISNPEDYKMYLML